MNKKKIVGYLPHAEKALREHGILSEDDRLAVGYAEQIAAFEAAVRVGDFRAVVALFCEDADLGFGRADGEVDRSKLICAMHELVCPGDGQIGAQEICRALIRADAGALRSLRADYLCAAAALKFVMQVFCA